MFDDVAELSGEDSGDETEDEEDNYIKDGFVTDDDLSEEDEQNEKLKKRGKKKGLKKRSKAVADEDDVELIREAQAQRNNTTLENLIEEDEEEDVIDPEGGGDYSDEGDFIADDMVNEEAPRKRYEPKEGRQGVTKSKIDEAIEIFGEDFVFEFEGGDSEYEDEYNSQPRRKTAGYEHIEIVESFLLPQDHSIVEMDVPERFQSYVTPSDKRNYRWRSLNGEDADVISDAERIAEARWIAEKMVDHYGRQSTLASLPPDDLVESIVNILKLMQVDHVEVPFIWLYRRDLIHRAFTKDHLWQTLQLDMKWCRLQYDIEITFRFLEKLSDLLSEKYPQDVAERLMNVKFYLDLLETTTDEEVIRDIRRFAALFATSLDKNSVSTRSATSANAVDGDDADMENDGVNSKDSDKPMKSLNKSLYSRNKKLDAVHEFISYFTAPVHEIGSAVHYDFPVNHPPTRRASPTESAAELIDGSKIRSIEQLTRAVKLVLATELSMEPSIRIKTREIFRFLGNISTEPTAKGKEMITPFSRFFGVHVISHKPIKEFFTHPGLILFMKMVEAEQLGYIKININGPDHEGMNKIMLHLGKFLIATSVNDDEYPHSRSEWDQFRISIIQLTVEKYLMPSMTSEIRAHLTRLGRDAIIDEAAAEFESRLKTGPYLPNYDNEYEALKSLLTNPSERPRAKSVAGFVFTQDKKMSLHMACVDEDGSLKAHREIPPQAMMQKKDKVETFLFENRPELIIINSGAGVQARSMQMLIERDIIPAINAALKTQYDFSKRSDDYPSFDDDEPMPTYYPKIMIGDDSLSSNFKNSKRAKKLLPTLSQQDARAAVSLARLAVEPLAEYANLWMTADSSTGLFGYEAFFINLHPLQKQVEGIKSKFIRALEFKLVDAISDVGVDIRKVCKLDHLAPMLAFIPGLGLRKADAFRRDIISKEAQLQSDLDEDEQRVLLESRKAILANHLLGPVVYNNAAGFLRITPSALISKLNPLDDTRIHPECYDDNDFVSKICFSALESDNDPSRAQEIIEELIKIVHNAFLKRLQQDSDLLQLWRNGRPDVTDTVVLPGAIAMTKVDYALKDPLYELDLNDFNESLKSENHGNRLLQMESVKEELRFPWLDLRWPFKEISSEQLFQIVSGETDETLYIGRKLGYKVVRHPQDTSEVPKSVIVETENNLKGYIGKFEVFDDRIDRDFDITKHLPIGSEGTAVVVGIRKDTFHVQLSIKPRYLKENDSWWLRNWHLDLNAKRYWVQRCFNEGDEEKSFDVRELYGILFDNHFDVEKALKIYDDIEDKQKNVVIPKGGGKPSASGKVNFQRMIVHPFFANTDAKGAEEKLKREGHGAGSVLFRPSSSSHDQLTITWQFQEGVFKHIHVKEEGKAITGLNKISDKLFIMEDDMENHRFYDIDEIHASYIEKLNELVQEMVKFHKFLKGSPQAVESILINEAANKPGTIPYCIRFEPGKPLFCLTFLKMKQDGSKIPTNIPVHVHFKVSVSENIKLMV